VDIQRLRNLTTGRLHTSIEDVVDDLEWITGAPGLMTHMLPRAVTAVEPWLRKHVTDLQFWEDRHDPSLSGEFTLPEPTAEERAEMFERYEALPSPLADKNLLGEDS
jgi:hypothetical protein